MPTEIERKFLVNTQKLPPLDNGKLLRQAYLTDNPARTVRIRISENEAFLTIKGPSNGISRLEFEYAIPKTEAMEILSLAIYPPLEKTRYKIPFDGIVWELDIFHGENEGLVLAEVEIDSEDQTVSLPEWISEEVSGDVRYFNSFLAKCPFKSWNKNKMV